jgi:hypothetical protein
VRVEGGWRNVLGPVKLNTFFGFCAERNSWIRCEEKFASSLAQSLGPGSPAVSCRTRAELASPQYCVACSPNSFACGHFYPRFPQGLIQGVDSRSLRPVLRLVLIFQW